MDHSKDKKRSASTNASEAGISNKKKKSLPPGCKPSDSPNYTFNPSSSIESKITLHARSFKCKIDGTPRPLYRNFATTKASASKVRLTNPSKPNLKSFKTSFSQALDKAQPNLFTLQGKPCILTVRFYFPRPKKHFIYNSFTSTYTVAPNAPLFVTKTPDLDNCIKLILDALQDVCYKNDFAVVHLDAAKIFDHTQTTWREGNNGCTIIKITEIDENCFQPDCSCLSCKTKYKSS